MSRKASSLLPRAWSTRQREAFPIPLRWTRLSLVQRSQAHLQRKWETKDATPDLADLGGSFSALAVETEQTKLSGGSLGSQVPSAAGSRPKNPVDESIFRSVGSTGTADGPQ